MACYRVAEGRQLSHSERVGEGYERRDLEVGDELELSDEDGKRLMDAGIVEPFNVAAKRRKASPNKARKVSANK